MRILMLLVLGFAAACLGGSYGLSTAALLGIAGVCLIPGAAGVLLGGRRRYLHCAGLILLGCCAGSLWFLLFRNVHLTAPEKLDGSTVTLEITAADYSQTGDYGSRLDGHVTLEGRDYRVYVSLREELELCPGDVIRGQFRVRVTTPEALESFGYFSGRGIFLLLYATEDPVEQIGHAESLRHRPALLRQQIRERVEKIFPQDAVPFARALLLGDTDGLDYETDTRLKVSGIRHIVAVSGLHISLLYGMVCRVTFRQRHLTMLIGTGILFLFAAVAGFSPSVVRSGVMIFLMMLAQAAERDYDPPTSLALAVLVMLLANPMSAGSVSLQLSVMCVAGILMYQKSINDWLIARIPAEKGWRKKLRAFFCGSISTSLAATVLVTPLSAYYFGMVSLVGPLTNLLTLWMVNLIFNGIVVCCLLYPLLPGAVCFLGRGLSWLVRYVLWVAKGLAELPVAAVYTSNIYVMVWLVLVYCLLLAFRLQKRKQPGALGCCVTLGLCAVLTATWMEPRVTPERITMMDVGQGQSILLESQGRAFLVDCGGENEEAAADIIANTLLSYGISRLDGIILTHYDADHSGALPYLLTRVETDLLILPDTCNDFTVPETDALVLYIWEDVELTFGESSLTIYGPVYSGYDNENSLCILFDTEKCDILITGDRSAFGERMLLRGRSLPDVDILVAGHHGAESSTSEELLRAVTPETVLISVAEDNIYGHPSPLLLRRLAALGCTVYRTDIHGTITIRR